MYIKPITPYLVPFCSWGTSSGSTKAHLDVREDASLLEGLAGFQWDQALSHESDPSKPKQEGPFVLCTQVRQLATHTHRLRGPGHMMGSGPKGSVWPALPDPSAASGRP